MVQIDASKAANAITQCAHVQHARKSRSTPGGVHVFGLTTSSQKSWKWVNTAPRRPEIRVQCLAC